MNKSLVKTNARGTIQFWTIQVHDCSIFTKWGVKNGKFQETTHIVETGKQKRSPQEQALFMANALVEKKLKSGYNIEGEVVIAKSPLPMLAKEYKNVKFENVAIQPKLDGIRCLANVKTGELWSRKQTRICGLDHISKTILNTKFHKNIEWLDGELYCHGVSFNEISSKVRRTTNFTNSHDIQYWIYDFVTKDVSFKERFTMLECSQFSSSLCLTPTQFMKYDHDKIVDLHTKAVQDRFEGIMIRNADSYYEQKRSSMLMKYKTFFQEEFKVIGFNQKKVVNNTVTLGSVILQSYNDENLVFSATPTMNAQEKLEIWENQSKYLNMKATIKYFEKTPKNIPRFPQLLGFRHKDDCE